MRKRNVLIITYSMIPHASSWGGCQRMYYLAEYLIREGYNVTVCSAKTNEEQFYGKEIHFSTMPLEIKNKIFRNFVYSKKVSHSNKKTDHISANFIGKLRNIIKGKKTLFKILVKIDEWIFNEPSYLMGLISRNWISSWKKEISDYITENEIDTLIVSGPPFGMFSIVKYIKKKNHISVILDYRDPWNLWHKRSLFARLAEKKNMKYVDCAVFTNHNLAKDMEKTFPIIKNKTYVVENGYSLSTWANIDTSLSKCEKKDFMELTYVGAIDISESSKETFRDVTKLLKAFERCIKDGLHIKLCFVGAANPSSKLASEIKEKYPVNFDVIGQVNSEDANIKLLHSDVLLLIHTASDHSSKYLISGKFYDYIKAQKPVMSIGDPNGNHAKIIRQNGIGVSCKNDVESIYRTMNLIYKKWKTDKLKIGELEIDRYSREYQNRNYSKLIDTLCRNKGK